MPKRFLVEVVISEQNEDEIRWRATGHIVRECSTKEEAERLAAQLIKWCQS